jgi:tRNA(Ile)-lysidine synthase
MDISPYVGWLARCRFPLPPTSVVCAVSGGADSAALAILAVAAGLHVHIVHVDHGLRGEGVGADEAETVRGLGRELGVEVDCVEVEVATTSNVEAVARKARYAALPDGALTGHTRDDQLETVLLQLCRGGGIDALAGIRPESRPLLALRRADTVEVCETFGYTPIQDPTNELMKFRRNRVRAEVVPLLDEIFERDVAEVVGRAADLVAAERDLLDRLAAAIDVTDVAAARSADIAVLRRAIRQWLHVTHPPDAATVERVLAVIAGDRKATEIGGGRRVRRSAGKLHLEYSGSSASNH